MKNIYYNRYDIWEILKKKLYATEYGKCLLKTLIYANNIFVRIWGLIPKLTNDIFYFTQFQNFLNFYIFPD